jgi:hypothetical protein
VHQVQTTEVSGDVSEPEETPFAISLASGLRGKCAVRCLPRHIEQRESFVAVDRHPEEEFYRLESGGRKVMNRKRYGRERGRDDT